MNFFKSLKAKLLGSIKEDLNSALGGQRASFNSKISGALDDLIAMKTGIKLSNIPSKITEEALLNAEGRAKAEKAIGESIAQITSEVKPEGREIMRFPTDDNRFVDNWIIFRTIHKAHAGLAAGTKTQGVGNPNDYGLSLNIDKDTGKEYNSADECTIMLYFPNNVKDAVNVDYEVRDIGLADIAVNDLSQFRGTDFKAMLGEQYDKIREGLVSFEQLQSGVVTGNPKFNTFQGVTFRNHSYSFSLNPYNKADAEEITKIIHWFKTMMLPMSMSANRRQMLMPAEWSIDFRGPILGHIEHPQNCFLTACDVDYSGGKDMSFIESFPQKDEDNTGFSQNDYSAMQHYPNGVILNLSFQEILNIDRIRYIDRVAANARGREQDVAKELRDFETNLKDQVNDKKATDEATEDAELAKRTWTSKSAAHMAKNYARQLGPEYEAYFISSGKRTIETWGVRRKVEGE
tara:strand:- start:1587 stop:2969 length:1383 start_codon:yes stop_codon:yes gene_type:complete